MLTHGNRAPDFEADCFTEGGNEVEASIGEFQRLSRIDPTSFCAVSTDRIRKISIFYVNRRFYDVATHLFYKHGEFYFTNPYTIFRFGRLMTVSGRASQLRNLILEIDLTYKVDENGDVLRGGWADFAPDITSLFSGLKALFVMFVDARHTRNWYGGVYNYCLHPYDLEVWPQVISNLRKAAKGGKYGVHLWSIYRDAEIQIRAEMDEIGKAQPELIWCGPWGTPLLSLLDAARLGKSQQLAMLRECQISIRECEEQRARAAMQPVLLFSGGDTSWAENRRLIGRT